MKKYIEQEAVIRLIKTEGFNEKYDLGHPKDNDWFCEEVNRIPAADVVEVRHAYWRDIQPPDQDDNVQCWCSACGAGELHANVMIVPYCWKCGAKMDGGADE